MLLAGSSMEKAMFIMGAAVIVVIAFIVFLLIYRSKKRKLVREGVYGGKFIPAEEFEANWMVGGAKGKHGLTGYKYEDTSGCYVILIFSHPVEDGDYTGYDDIYIGQSVNVCKRVHSHLNGKGNGDVYADMKNGKHVYVQFQNCPKEDMNDLEKSLIAAFDATKSYNSTRGGSAKR